MTNLIKNILRKCLIALHIDATKNLKYDRLTKKIFAKVLKENSSTIDVGCHKGEVLEQIIASSPIGKHFAFEPIPVFYNNLKRNKKFNAVTFFNVALANNEGSTDFNYVKNAPAYSGIKLRKYDVSKPEIESLIVPLNKLDNLIGNDYKIDLIKIDVEGAEYGVIAGGKNLILSSNPVIVFEFGKGASEYYDNNPEKMFNLLSIELGYGIFTLSGFLKSEKSLSLSQLKSIYESEIDYYFVAAKN